MIPVLVCGLGMRLVHMLPTISGIPLDTVNLVRELRDNSLFVPGFLTSELNVFVHNVTTS